MTDRTGEPRRNVRTIKIGFYYREPKRNATFSTYDAEIDFCKLFL
jgi:hypothetical protein